MIDFSEEKIEKLVKQVDNPIMIQMSRDVLDAFTAKFYPVERLNVSTEKDPIIAYHTYDNKGALVRLPLMCVDGKDVLVVVGLKT